MTIFPLMYCLNLAYILRLKEINMADRKLSNSKVSLKSDERLRLYLNGVDAKQIQRGWKWTAEVTDIDRQVRYKLRGCACSAPHCMCDAYVVDTYLPLS